MRVELGLLRHRTIGVAGIRLHNLRYQSSELIEYRKYCASNNGKKLFVKTKTDPADISYIHVYIESEKRYIKVPAVDNSGYTKGLSLFEHERIQKVRRLNTKQLADDEALADTFLYMKKRIQEETDRFRSTKSNRSSLPKTGNTSKLARFNDVAQRGQAQSIRLQLNKKPL